MVKKLVLTLLFFLLLVNAVSAVEKPQLYMPYPIIFVSGIGTKPDTDIGMKGSPSREWPSKIVFSELGKYFLIHPEVKESIESKYEFEDKDIKNLKLQPGEKPNLQFLFYDAQQATLATNADLLKDRINEILDPNEGGYYKLSENIYTEPCSTPKVILVCHSLGGLIARKMLVDNHDKIQDKVAAIFFIGSQQEGSPLGVAAYFLPKEILALKKDVDDINSTIDGSDWFRKRALLNVKEREESKIVGNLRLMKWIETEDEVFIGKVRDGLYITSLPGLYVSTRDGTDNKDLKAVLGDDFEDKWYLPKVTEKGVVKGTLINSDSANSYRHTFTAYSFNGPFGIDVGAKVVRSVPETGPLRYDLSEAVFSDPAVDRNIGDVKAHAIAGNSGAVLRVGFCAMANSFMGWDNFSTLDYTCISNGFWKGGDGFSNLASQKAIVPVANAHEIPAAHTSFPSTPGELDFTGTPDIILQAIDDKPVIDSISVVPGDFVVFPELHLPTFFYVKVKVKDYLLADIEIVDMSVNGNKVVLPDSFYDPETRTYKPYRAYLKFEENILVKNFLKERTDPDAPISPPMPEIPGYNLTLEPGEFWVRVDTPNPHFYNPIHNVFVRVRNAAGKETFKEIVYPYHKEVYKPVHEEGDSEEGMSFADVKLRAYNSFLSQQKRLWDPGGYFIGPIGSDVFWSDTPYLVYGWDENHNPITRTAHHYNVYIEAYYSSWFGLKIDSPPDKIKPIKLLFTSASSTADFNVLVYHDSLNTWPPTVNSNAGTLPVSRSVRDMPIEIVIDPQRDIGPGGWYVLQFKPDFDVDSDIQSSFSNDNMSYKNSMIMINPIAGYITVEPKE